MVDRPDLLQELGNTMQPIILAREQARQRGETFEASSSRSSTPMSTSSTPMSSQKKDVVDIIDAVIEKDD